MAKMKKAQPGAIALPFPPAGLHILPDGMVAAALQMGGVISSVKTGAFFLAENMKFQANNFEDERPVPR